MTLVGTAALAYIKAASLCAGCILADIGHGGHETIEIAANTVNRRRWHKSVSIA